MMVSKGSPTQKHVGAIMRNPQEDIFEPHLTPGDPTRVDDCALLHLPHKVAQVRRDEQHMGHPGKTEG